MRLFLSLIFYLFLQQTYICPQYLISGKITDSTGKPLKNAKIEIQNQSLEYNSNRDGVFNIVLINPGEYNLKVNKDNFAPLDTILILSENIKAIYIRIKLREYEHQTDTIKVETFYQKKTPEISTSFINSKYEEIRRNPGSFEDVVKYYNSVPGVLSGNDNNNHLLVRGGSSFENLILVDGFEIPNPNHYGPPGSSNGALSFINSKLIGEVDFFSGGFPSRFGDKLSSVMDIRFKDGNSKKHIRDLNLAVTGYGGFFEGPISKKVSYMFSVRKSYFELIKEQLASALLPDYWDFNGKLSYKTGNNEVLSLTGTYVIDHAEAYKISSNLQDTVDMKLFNGSFRYSNIKNKTKVSFITGYSSSFYDAKYIHYELSIAERYFSSVQNFTLKMNKKTEADLTAGLKYFISDYKIYHFATFNESGYYVPELNINDEVRTVKLYGGINLRRNFFGDRLTVNAGIRIDYFEYMHNAYSFSPRLGLVFHLWDKTNLMANAGIYFQSPELSWLVTYPENRKLEYIKCVQLIGGIEQFIGDNIKLTIEGFLKQYSNYPVSVFDPNYIFINNGVDLYPNFLDKAVSAGKGYFTGIDIFSEQRNSGNGLFWSAGYSYSFSKFLALTGNYQKAEFDPTHQINLTAGFKFPFGFSISGHFKYAGGRPYTPYDMEKSHFYNRGIFIENYYNKARLPEYIRLDLRAEQEFQPFNTNLILYIEVLNVLNRTNLYEYNWDFGTNKLNEFIQFKRIPVIGISWKF